MGKLRNCVWLDCGHARSGSWDFGIPKRAAGKGLLERLFAEHVHNNWSQEVAITSAIFIVSLGITVTKFAIENAVSKKALEKKNSSRNKIKIQLSRTLA